MRRLFILLIAALLILSGCSNNINSEVNTDTPNVSEPDEEIISKNTDTENEEKDVKVETSDEIIEKPEEDNQPAEVPADEPLDEQISEAIVEEAIAEEAIAEETVTDEQTENNQVPNMENTLKIKGLLEKELALTVDQLKAMNEIIVEADFYSLNSFGTTGYTHFKGVKLWELLSEVALIKPEASKITVTAQDGYSMEFTIGQVQMEYMDETNPQNKYPMIIAWEENGEVYSTDEGAPYKLVVGQKEPGDVNKPQWVSNIDIILVE
jgi:DMSO/TMAO reductase YedYZ molybdopterin-dependent catalytic subunit